jgi:prevent-host-death family protein
MHRRNQRTLMLSASEFKKRCASVVTEVHSTREPVLITKFGKPIARLVPAGRNSLDD